MGTRASLLLSALVALAAGGAAAACSELIGADFDVTRAGADAGPDAACASPPCAVLIADGLDHPWGIALEGGYVYWTVAGATLADGGTGKVMRAAIAGGAPEELATGLLDPDQIAIEGEYAYVTLFSNTDGAILRIRKDTSGDVSVFAPSQVRAVGVASDGANLYWTTGENLKTRALDAGPGEGTILFTGKEPGLLHVANGLLTWAEYAPDGGVWQMPVDGGPPELVSSGEDAPNAPVAVQPHLICFTSSVPAPQGAVKCAADGSGASFVLAGNQDAPAGLATDGDFLYWASFGGGTVLRIPRTGGTIEELAKDPSANGIAVDDVNVYWTTYKPDGHVMRRPKK